MDQPSRKNNSDNRRDFLRESLMLAAVPAALVTNVAESALIVGASRPSIKLGLLGCGKRGMQLSRAALDSTLTNVQLCGLADLFPDRVQQTFRAINGTFPEQVLVGATDRFTGIRAAEQLADSDVQAVIVAAAPGFRVNHLRLLANAGKHIYVERPLATSVADTLQVAELAQAAIQRGQVIQFGMQHRFQPFFLSLLEQLHRGAIGRPVLARIALERPIEQLPARSKRVSEHDFRLRHWQHDSSLGGHPVVEQMSGQIDLINWIVGSTPESARPVVASKQLTEVQMTYSTGLRLECQLHSVQQGAGAGLQLLVQGTSGWCDLLRGKIFDQSNNLQWSAVGTPADSQAAVNAWLKNLQGECQPSEGNFLRQHVNVSVDATLASLLAQTAIEQRQATSWQSIVDHARAKVGLV